MAQPKTMLGPKPGKDEMFIKIGHPKDIKEATTGMKGGESREGFLGEGNIIRKPDYVPKPDDVQSLMHKKVIQKRLLEIIDPNPLSAKSTVEMDRRSLVNKLKKSSLADLKRLLPKRLGNMDPRELEIAEILEEEKAEIQDLYKDVSP